MKHFDQILLKNVRLRSNELYDINGNIMKKLKQHYEHRFIPKGYINEIKSINTVSSGIVDKDSLNKEIEYNVSFKCDIDIIEKNDVLFGCIVKSLNDKHMFLEYSNATILIPPGIFQKDYLKTYKENDNLNIYVVQCRIELGKSLALIIGDIYFYAPMAEIEGKILIEFAPLELNNNETRTDINSINITDNSINNGIIPLVDLGYNNKIDELKKQIDRIDPEIWNFYKMLCNPYELVFPSIKYYNKKLINLRAPNRSYFKMWEMLTKFSDLIVFDPAKTYNYVSLCEAPGGFIKAIYDYRNNPGDKFNAISLKNDINFSSDLNKIKNLNLEDGDITNIPMIKKYIKKFSSESQKAYIVTADGGFSTAEQNFEQERESTRLIFMEMLTGINVQVVGGTMILKIFDCYSQATVDIIYILYLFYNKVIIYKPQMSRPANSEKYIIAVGFKGLDIIPKLNDKLFDYIENHKDNLTDSFVENINDQYFIQQIKIYNATQLELQYNKINEILSTIKSYKYAIPTNKMSYITRQIKIAIDWFEKNNLKHLLVEDVNKLSEATSD